MNHCTVYQVKNILCRNTVFRFKQLIFYKEFRRQVLCIHAYISGYVGHASTLWLCLDILTGRGVCYPCLRTRHINIHCNGACQRLDSNNHSTHQTATLNIIQATAMHRDRSVKVKQIFNFLWLAINERMPEIQLKHFFVNSVSNLIEIVLVTLHSTKSSSLTANKN